MVLDIPRLPLARNAVFEDLKPERKVGARWRIAREAIFWGGGEGEVELGDETGGKAVSLAFPPDGFRDVREPPESENVPERQ